MVVVSRGEFFRGHECRDRPVALVVCYHLPELEHPFEFAVSYLGVSAGPGRKPVGRPPPTASTTRTLRRPMRPTLLVGLGA